MKIKREFLSGNIFRVVCLLVVGLFVLTLGVFEPVLAAGEPDLTISKSHVGDFSQGDVGSTYTITVTNISNNPTNGTTVTVTEFLPVGLTATAIAGTGWNCNLGLLECTRSDVLGGLLSYPPITVTVDVALDAPGNVINEVAVAGGGEVNDSNSSATDPTVITQIADLTINKSHVGSFTQGGAGAYTIIVTNNGDGPTDGSEVSVVDTLPSGLTATGMSGSGWTCTLATLTCTRSDVLDSGNTYPSITLSVNVAVNASANITNTVDVSGGGELFTSNNTGSDPTTVIQKPDLIITNVTLSPTPRSDIPFDVSITVKNQGGEVTESIVYRHVYIDTDNPYNSPPDPETGCPTLDTDYFRGDFNDTLPAGASDTKSVSITTGLSEGNHQIWVFTDATCINSEGDEDNNVYGPININVSSSSTFADVPYGAFAWAHIESIYAAGITGGCSVSPLNYCPNNTVTRAQMAIFLLRGIHGASYTPPAATGTVFSDVPANAFAAAWIERLVAEGITAGCGSGNYCPNSTVTRAQMAVFLMRAKYGAAYSPPAATGTAFIDVPSNSFAAAWIEKLVADGITSGCGGGNYCPFNVVTRAQMAVFLQRTFNLPLP